MDKKDESRLFQLLKEALASPIEPDDAKFWQKRREALQRAIANTRKSKTPKLSS